MNLNKRSAYSAGEDYENEAREIDRRDRFVARIDIWTILEICTATSLAIAALCPLPWRIQVALTGLFLLLAEPLVIPTPLQPASTISAVPLPPALPPLLRWVVVLLPSADVHPSSVAASTHLLLPPIFLHILLWRPQILSVDPGPAAIHECVTAGGSFIRRFPASHTMYQAQRALLPTHSSSVVILRVPSASFLSRQISRVFGSTHFPMLADHLHATLFPEIARAWTAIMTMLPDSGLTGSSERSAHS